MSISDVELSNLCQLIDSEKSYRIKKFINQKDKIRSLVGEISMYLFWYMDPFFIRVKG